LACRGLIAVVFISAAWGKVAPSAFGQFVQSVEQTGMVPRAAARPVAVAVVLAELSAALLVLLPGTSAIGAGLAACLLVVFLGVIVRSLKQGSAAQCRCFGSASPLGRRHVVRNVGLLFACAGALPAVPELGTSDAPALALAAVCTLVVGLLVVRLDDLMDLFGPPAHPQPRGYRP
jgi:uncharacterized membrane protein YphA (DoxX/SURF4 family)